MTSFTVDQHSFRRSCSRFPTGVTITTALGPGNTPLGLTVSAFTSVSLDPPLVLVCIHSRSPILDHLSIGSHFGVSVLSEDQEHICSRFAQKTPNRFEGLSWRLSEYEVPLIEGALATFDCSLVQKHPAGDHVILIGEVQQTSHRDGQPLTYFASACGALGRPLAAKHVGAAS